MPEDVSNQTEEVVHLRTAKRDWLGSIIGLAIVAGGMAILYTVFKEAWHLFATPPQVALNVQPGKPIEVNSAFNSITGIIIKIILLIIMAWLGSVITNRGIFLYSHSRQGRKS